MRYSAKAIAELAAEGGRLNYVRDGEVVPTLLLVGDSNGIILHPNPELSERPPVAYAEVIYRVGKLYPWRVIGCASETWMRSYSPEEHADEYVRRGDLERAHAAGDTRVETAILGIGLDLRNRFKSHTELCRAIGEPPNVEWDTTSQTGVMDGDMPEMMLDAYERSPAPPRRLTMPPLSLMVDVLEASGLATTALLMNP